MAVTLAGMAHACRIDCLCCRGLPYEVNERCMRNSMSAPARVLELALKGNIKDAQALLAGEFKERSEKVVRALNKWKGELLSSTRAA